MTDSYSGIDFGAGGAAAVDPLNVDFGAINYSGVSFPAASGLAALSAPAKVAIGVGVVALAVLFLMPGSSR